jgi:hypothetical protein
MAEELASLPVAPLPRLRHAGSHGIGNSFLLNWLFLI